MSHEIASLTPEILAEWRRENRPHALLDVREDQELAICAVKDAIHVPMGQIPARSQELPKDLPKDLPVVVMCHHGMRSLRVAQYLKAQGWESLYNLEGGIHAWAEQVEPEMPRY